jgi:hypothetical protein
MHLLYIARSRRLLENIYHLLDTFLDPMYAGMHTTASAPSLRASEPYAMMAPLSAAADPGNVKVVVRCRAFVRRGEQTYVTWSRDMLTGGREGEGHQMPDSHGPGHAEDNTACAR